MRFKKDHKAETRERILGTAASLFRRDGMEKVSVPALMKQAGLTHGGFYAHFASKDALAAEALATALAATSKRFAAAAQEASEPRFAAVADDYLSGSHRDHPEDGCAVAALGAETARDGAPETRRALVEGMLRTADVVAETLPGGGGAGRRDDAIFLMASMVGALIVARILKDDPSVSDHVLAVCRERIKAAADDGVPARTDTISPS